MLKCDVLLVTVTDVETKALDTALTATTGREHVLRHGEDLVYRDWGEIAGARVLHVRCEMGSDTVGGSAVTLTRALLETKASSVLMTGIAFGVDPEKQKVGTILVSKQLQGYELQRIGTDPATQASTVLLRGDCVSASPRLLGRLRYAKEKYEGRKPIEFEKVLSGQKLIDNHDYRKQLERLCPEAKGGEMEGQGLYAAARDKAEWVLVKAVCDWADGNKSKDKKRKQKTAAKAAAEFVVHALKLGGFGPGPASSLHGSEPREPSDDDAVLAEHRDRLARQLAPVKVLRNIANNEAGRGQSKIRLEDVFVCPQLLSEAEQDRVDGLDQRLLDRTSGEDRTESARYGEYVRWQPERWATSSMSVGRGIANHRTLMVVGDPGSGKSTLLAALVLATRSEPLSQGFVEDAGDAVLYGRIPFYLRLPQLASEAPDEAPNLLRALGESLTVSVSPEQATHLVDHALRSERAIVLLDALDEVPSSAARQRVADAIEAFCTEHPKCPVVVTTREGGRTMIPGFTAVHLPPMTHADMGRFIARWRWALGQTATHEPPTPHTVAALGELGRNPLMLLVMLLSGGLELPQRERVLFYERALHTMLTTWRGSPDDAQEPTVRAAWRAWGEVALRLRGDDSGGVLPRPALERHLREALHAQGAKNAEALAPVLVEDALRKSGLVIKRGNELGFWHSTFGEYLAATALARDTSLDRFMELRRDHRNVEVAVMTIDHLAHVDGDEDRAAERLRALIEHRDTWDDLEGTQLAFAVECLVRGCHARRAEIDRCLEVVLRLCREFPYGATYRTSFSRLVSGLPTHVPGPAMISALAQVVEEKDPPAALDDIAPLLAAACSRQPAAVAACEALLHRTASAGGSFQAPPSLHRAFAALGLVESGRLEPDLLPALVELPWFADPRRGLHRHDDDPLEARGDRMSFLGHLSRALLGSRSRLSTRWLAETTDERQHRCIAPLLAVAAGTTEPEAAVITSLLETATSRAQDGVRENARGMLGRIALRHHAVRSELVRVALQVEGSEDPSGHGLEASKPAHWAQPLLLRIASTDPRVSTWLVDTVARSAFSSLLEQTGGLALHFLRHILHERRDWHSLLVEAVRQRKTETELWPRLAAFTLLLEGGGLRVHAPDPEIWLACVRSEDPWFQVVALERWHPGPWPRDALAEEIVEAFVGACTALLAHPPRQTPPADQRLRVLVRDTGSSLDARWAAEHWLSYVIKGDGAVSQQVIDAIGRRLPTSTTEQAVVLALLLVETGGSAEIPEAMDVVRQHGLGSTDAEIRARAAQWLAKHAQQPSAAMKDELQLAMLGGSYRRSSDGHAEAIRGMGPPSNELIHRMVANAWSRLDSPLPRGWLFSNRHALDILIGYLRDDVPEGYDSAARRLLETDPKDDQISDAILARASESDPDTCGRLAGVVESRLGARGSEDPRLDALWCRALTSENPSNLYRALCNRPLSVWLGTEREPTRAAIQRLLADESPVLRLLVTWLFLMYGERQIGGDPTVSEAVAALSEAMGMDAHEIASSMLGCLDAPEPQVRLLAVCFLLGLAAAPETCKTTLRQLMETEGEAATEPLFLLHFAIFGGLTIEGLLKRVLRGQLGSPAAVVTADRNHAPSLRDVTELLRWIYDDGAVPTRIDEILRGLGDQANEERLHAAVCLARSPIAKVREPAFLAITNAIEGSQETTWHVYQNTVELIAEPDRFETVMAWSMTVAQSRGHDPVSGQLDSATENDPRLRRRVFEWLEAAAVANEAGYAPHRVETAIRIMFRLDHHARRSGRIPATAIPPQDEPHGSAADYLRAHWRELPLSPKRLLDLAFLISHFYESPCPGLRSEIIEHFLQSPDRKTRALALEAWATSSKRNRLRERALQVWREFSATPGSRSFSSLSSIATDLITPDFAPDDVVAFLRGCANDTELPVHQRLRALSALDRSPGERSWVESRALELLGSSSARDLQNVIEWWVKRQRSRDEALPLPLIRALVQLAPSGWLPGELQRSRGFDERHSVPLTNTPFDSSFAEVFAELLHEDAPTLHALFDAARRRDALSPEQRDHILRTLRVQPTDDPTTRLARRWWHHQLVRDDPRADDLLP